MRTLEQKIDGLAVGLNTLSNRVDTLATTMADGFRRVDEQIENLAIVVKNGFDDVYARFERIDARFDQMDKHFDRIENISIGGHERRIEILEDRVGIINKKLGLSRK